MRRWLFSTYPKTASCSRAFDSIERRLDSSPAAIKIQLCDLCILTAFFSAVQRLKVAYAFWQNQSKSCST